MELRIEAARNRVPQAGALADPILTVGALNVPVPSFSFGHDDMTMKMASLEQMVPAPGKRRAAEALASADVEVARAMHAEHVNRLVSEVVNSFFEIAELDARLMIARRGLDRATRVSESVRNRYSVGQGSLPDPLLAAVEETKFRDRIRALEAERAVAATRFNTLQNQPPDQGVAEIAVLSVDRGLPDPGSIRSSIERSPAILQAQAEVRRAERDLDRARLDRRPDLTFMTSYGERQRRDDMVGATVGVSLPFFQAKRVSARIAEKQAELGAAKKKLDTERVARRHDEREADGRDDRKISDAGRDDDLAAADPQPHRYARDRHPYADRREGFRSGPCGARKEGERDRGRCPLRLGSRGRVCGADPRVTLSGDRGQPGGCRPVRRQRRRRS